MAREERDGRDHGEERERPRRARHPAPETRPASGDTRRASDENRPASGDSRRSTSENRRPASESRRPSADARRPAATARTAARSAARQLRDLTGHDPESVTSVERHEDGGWLIGVEVLETHRIPDSTDILAEYRVEVDDEGGLVSYRRARRYYRGRSEERT
ncbi:gas vesicle protein GvpO [Streptomyces sp. NPDC005962]|uniref:gas vesicle protein GvpO n=1 Tax=Streptomyces sp. NPDC005962 TaxID=3154466 RepID=UPI003403700F